MLITHEKMWITHEKMWITLGSNVDNFFLTFCRVDNFVSYPQVIHIKMALIHT